MSLLNEEGKEEKKTKEKQNKPKILVIGATGVGKSSLIRFITGRNDVEISNDAVGCSLTCEVIESDDYAFVDTVGLNETSSGSVPGPKAFDALVKFLKQNKGGFNLAIFVLKQGRITLETKNTYDLLTKILDPKIPMLLCITGCENDDPLGAWYKKNKDNFRNANLNFVGAVSVCFAYGGRMEKFFEPLREQSTKLLHKHIALHMLPEPIPLYKGLNGYIEMLRTLWNFLAARVNNSLIWINDKFVDLLVRIGYSREQAVVKARELEREEF